MSLFMHKICPVCRALMDLQTDGGYLCDVCGLFEEPPAANGQQARNISNDNVLQGNGTLKSSNEQLKLNPNDAMTIGEARDVLQKRRTKIWLSIGNNAHPWLRRMKKEVMALDLALSVLEKTEKQQTKERGN